MSKPKTARRPWKCPHCGTSWAIPLSAKDPKQCPECDKTDKLNAESTSASRLPDNTDWQPPRIDISKGSREKSAVRNVRRPSGASVVLIVFSFLAAGMAILSLVADPKGGLLIGLFVFAGLLLLWLACFAVYMAPTIVAVYRGHPNVVPIVVLNLFLGWTIFGWAGALAWALVALEPSGPSRQVVTHIHRYERDEDYYEEA